MEINGSVYLVWIPAYDAGLPQHMDAEYSGVPGLLLLLCSPLRAAGNCAFTAYY